VPGRACRSGSAPSERVFKRAGLTSWTWYAQPSEAEIAEQNIQVWKIKKLG